MLWRSYAVDIGEMDTGKCREGGRNLLHCPPARPDRDYIKIWASGHAWAVLVARRSAPAASTGLDVIIWTMGHGHKPCGGVRGAALGREDGQGKGCRSFFYQKKCGLGPAVAGLHLGMFCRSEEIVDGCD